MSLVVVILAAGQGTRMKSCLPKVLHKLAGKPLLEHAIDAGKALNPDKTCVVYGHGGESVKDYFSARSDLVWVQQTQQLGTGHAVQQVTQQFTEHDTVLILYGDVPLIKSTTLEQLTKAASTQSLGLITVDLDNPKGYGRIIRDDDKHVTAIVEEKDASTEQKAITEINSGIMAFYGGHLKNWLSKLDNNNSQGEYYLTDIIALAHQDNISVNAIKTQQETEVMGVNDRRQLAELERRKQQELIDDLMSSGVSFIDPSRVDIRGEVNIAQDVSIDIDVILEGNVVIEEGVKIGPFSHIINSQIGKNTIIKSHSIVEDSIIKSDCSVGPYARLRPGSYLENHARIGNFVEVKKSTIGEGSKVNHLSYIGDSRLGKNVNIGAGTITCNYDGANKHQTTIENDVFIGSNSSLVAPVKINKGATVGAGSTISKDTPENTLVLTRAKQVIKDNWKRPDKVKGK